MGLLVVKLWEIHKYASTYEWQTSIPSTSVVSEEPTGLYLGNYYRKYILWGQGNEIFRLSVIVTISSRPHSHSAEWNDDRPLECKRTRRVVPVIKWRDD